MAEVIIEELDDAEKKLLDVMKLDLENETGSEYRRANTAYSLAFKEFYPWYNARNTLIKRYWHEIGGMKVLVDALRRAPEGTDLQKYLASAIWRLGESEQLSLEAVKGGAVSVAIDLLIVYEELLDTTVEEAVIDVFVDQVLKINERNINDAYSSRLMATIQSIINNSNCRERLLKIAPHLVSLLTKFGNYNTGIRTQLATLNHSGAVLAALANDERIYEFVPKEAVEKALTRATKRLYAEKLAEAEKSLPYVWTYFNRFIQLFESDNVLVKRYCALSMSYLAISEVNRTKLIKQGLLGRIQMLTFSTDKKTQKFAQSAMKRFNMPFVASLQTFAYWKLLEKEGADRGTKIIAECNITVQ